MQLKRNGNGQKSVEALRYRERDYAGKDLWNRKVLSRYWSTDGAINSEIGESLIVPSD